MKPEHPLKCRSRVYGSLLVLGLVLGVFVQASLVNARPPTPVRAATAEELEISDRIEALGTLLANESVDISANVTEIIETVNFEDGQRVKQGQVLATMISAEETALLGEAKALANEARKQYSRAQNLAKRGATAVSELDEARRVAETAEARLKAIEAQAENLVLTAPFDGVVGLRNISVGALVRPGDLITTLDDDSEMKLDFTVPAIQIGALRSGEAIEATTAAYPNQKFQGSIRSISSRVDPVTRTATVRATLPNPDGLLKPGLLMKVSVDSQTRRTVSVPESALLPSGRRQFVLVIEEKDGALTAHRTEVEIGNRQRGTVEVTSGLQAGQKVIVDGAFKIADGAAVRLIP